MKTLDLKARFNLVADKYFEAFDTKEHMHIEKFGSPGYHTTLTDGYVHRTYDSLLCAASMFLAESEEYSNYAKKTVEKVLTLQDTDVNSKTFGIWSWFLEESLEQMSPPDWNWANFCGKELLQMIITNGNCIDEKLRDNMITSIHYCCQSIMRRNVSPKYTNIAVMGSFVTIVGGEYLKSEEYLNYGKNLLKQVYEEVKGVGNFSEFNSPTYTIIAVCDLKRLLNYVSDKESLSYAQWMYNKAWECIAKHFHFKTGEWSGPHARCYDSLRDNTFYSFLYDTTDGKVDRLSDDEYVANLDTSRLNVKCPDEYIKYFCEFSDETIIDEPFDKKETTGIVLRAYTLMNENYCLGSFNKMDMWNQRRNVLAYYGTQEKSTYMHMRFMHDDYDFGSAIMTAKQKNSVILGMINFAIDSGDRHNDLDLVKNSTVSAESMRLSFEIGGNVDDVVLIPNEKENECSFKNNDIITTVKMNFTEFGEYIPKFKVNKNENKIFIESILYEGERTEINLKELDKAVCVFTVSINEEIPNVTISEDNNKITAKAGDLLVSNYKKCMPKCEL